MPRGWYGQGMARTRISTTVDAELLDEARRVRAGLTDSRLIDEALAALLARRRAAEVDAAYAAYDARPVEEPDVGGDLASLRDAAGRSGPRPPRGARSGGASFRRPGADRSWSSPATRRSRDCGAR